LLEIECSGKTLRNIQEWIQERFLKFVFHWGRFSINDNGLNWVTSIILWDSVQLILIIFSWIRFDISLNHKKQFKSDVFLSKYCWRLKFWQDTPQYTRMNSGEIPQVFFHWGRFSLNDSDWMEVTSIILWDSIAFTDFGLSWTQSKASDVLHSIIYPIQF